MSSWPCLVCACLLATAACSSPAETPPPRVASKAILFEGAQLIVGDGSPAIADSAFVIENGMFARVGKKGELQISEGAERVDLTGKTVMPALVDAHSHLGYTNVKTMTTSAANFTRENLVDHLNRYAYYGIAATLSMGVDRGELPFELRAQPVPGAALFRTAGRGIALPNAGPGADYRRDAPYGVTTEGEARQVVQELAAKQVDIVKIWVDDRDGTVQKLPPPMYRAIIDEAHARGLRVVAHIFDLADAKELLRAGIDGFAHGVRDKDIDDEFLALMKERPNVFVIPNLPDRGIADDLSWLADTVPAAEIQRMRDEVANRKPETARQVRELYDVQARNLARLNAAGVKIGYGTDAGISVGWNALTELSDMVAAGMTPAQVIVAATRTSADILQLDDLGTIAPGKSADFIALDANPLDDITNARRISRVYLRGQEVDRAALRKGWSGE
ncbi:MAG TPA: amidohydrolase family protein [Vicinamibacterales bacterium]|nr:amidohydrolase family protein [Vicinamibacterales bacterium]